jgi:hypothetical protein
MAGGIVQVAVVVRNVGSGVADDVALKIHPPAGGTLGGEDPGALPMPAASAETEDTPFWQCDFGSVWRCTYGAVGRRRPGRDPQPAVAAPAGECP